MQPCDFEQSAIGDYGLIGDCRTAALISKSGAMVWLCLPDYSSPSIFAAILDTQRGGGFIIRPRASFATQRKYLPGTVVLETTFETQSGTARVIDLLPLIDGVDSLQPMREILRVIEGISGEVDFEIRIEPRPNYARTPPRLNRRGALGWHFSWSNELLAIGSVIELGAKGAALEGTARVRRNERRCVSLAYVKGDPAIPRCSARMPIGACLTPCVGGDGGLANARMVAHGSKKCGVAR